VGLESIKVVVHLVEREKRFVIVSLVDTEAAAAWFGLARPGMLSQ